MLAANPMCARRGDEWWWPGPSTACTNLATEDDHIVSIAQGGDLDDPANHQGLCHPCHLEKAKAEAALGRGRAGH